MSVCRNCGDFLEPKKMLCRRCGEWTPNGEGALPGAALKEEDFVDATEVQAQEIARILTGGPWDEAWGGGFVPSTITLLGGAPGAGKTTLLLQLAVVFAQITKKPTYYISAEQHKGALKLTLDRLGLPLEKGMLRLLNVQGGGGTIDEGALDKAPPGMMILDSVSALCGNDKHMQVAVCKQYIKYAIKYKCKVFLIAHMTKEHDYAGLMALQHEVDALVTLFPDDDGGTRILKPWKNRYGATHAEFKLIMTEKGFVAPPPEPEKKGRGRKVTFEGPPIGDGLPAGTTAAEVPPPAPEPTALETAPPPPRKNPFKRPAVDAILMPDGQKLVRKDKKGRAAIQRGAASAANVLKGLGTAKRPERAAAVEGEALKKRRAPMPKIDVVKARTAKPERAAPRKTARKASELIEHTTGRKAAKREARA
jgi:predicted ATPase